MFSQKVNECSKALAKKKWTVAFVESASAGKMSYAFSTVPDSGKILLGGVVCYNAFVKQELLQIPKSDIVKFTPESPEITKSMANNFCRHVEADICVALTGLTAPGGSETKEKPVGTIFIHIIFPDEQIARTFHFNGNPDEIVDQAIDATAIEILEKIQSK